MSLQPQPNPFSTLLAAAPGFPPRWLAHFNGPAADSVRGLAMMGCYIHDLVVAGEEVELAAIFAATEAVLLSGDAVSIALIGEGLLDTLRHIRGCQQALENRAGSLTLQIVRKFEAADAGD